MIGHVLLEIHTFAQSLSSIKTLVRRNTGRNAGSNTCRNTGRNTGRPKMRLRLTKMQLQWSRNKGSIMRHRLLTITAVWTCCTSLLCKYMISPKSNFREETSRPSCNRCLNEMGSGYRSHTWNFSEFI